MLVVGYLHGQSQSETPEMLQLQERIKYTSLKNAHKEIDHFQGPKPDSRGPIDKISYDLS